MTGKKTGTTLIRDPGLRRLRALRVLERRITGHSLADIAKEFNVSRLTVKNILDWAKRADLVASAEDKILSELVPAAHAAILSALKDGNAEIALKIFEGTIPSFSKQKPTTPVTVAGDDDLASYVNQLRSQSGVIDGEVGPTESPLGADSPTEASAAPQRLLIATESLPIGDGDEALGAESGSAELLERTSETTE